MEGAGTGWPVVRFVSVRSPAARLAATFSENFIRSRCGAAGSNVNPAAPPTTDGRTPSTSIVNIRETVLTPPPAVPPSSVTVTVMVTVPAAPVTGVTVIDPTAPGLAYVTSGLPATAGLLEVAVTDSTCAP